MRIIFLKDVPRVGKRHDVKEVNDGYAANFLFPRQLAEPATPKTIAQLEKRKKEISIQRETEENLLLQYLTEIKGKVITIKVKADEKGHLFSAIHPKEIVDQLKKEHAADVKENCIDLEKPIKEVGEFEIPIEVKDKKASFKLIVEKI